MTTWRLDIDEGAIYCGDKRVAALDTDHSNDGWREACRVGQDMVDAMNGADRADFEARMRAAGHSPTALIRLDSGGYLSPTVNSEWRSEKDAASYNGQFIRALRNELAAERERHAAWFSLVMNCAAAVESAAHCLRDPDAIRAAEGAAKHYRAAANAMTGETR